MRAGRGISKDSESMWGPRAQKYPSPFWGAFTAPRVPLTGDAVTTAEITNLFHR